VIGIIPAAGKGNRLRPITDFIPKELLLYGPRPFIRYCLDNLRASGIERALIIVGYKKGSIMDYVKDGRGMGVNVDYAYQVEQKGLGDAILTAEGKLNEDREIFILLGDNVIEPESELKRLKELYLEEKPFGVILVEESRHPSLYGVVKFKGMHSGSGEISEVFEKPGEKEVRRFETDGKVYAISGAYILSTKIFGYLRKAKPDKNGELQLTDAIRLALEGGERIIAMKLDGKRIDIGTPYNYLMEQHKLFKGLREEDVRKLSQQWE